MKRQHHSHTKTCEKKKQGECRFHFPRTPQEATTVVRLSDSAQTEADRAACKQLLDSINAGTGVWSRYKSYLEKPDVVEQIKFILTTRLFPVKLNEQSVFEVIYCAEVMVLEKRRNAEHGLSDDCMVARCVGNLGGVCDKLSDSSSSGTTEIRLKRGENEALINSYNGTVLRAWQANMDIQFVTNAQAVRYILDYICKPESELGDVMKNALQDMPKNCAPRDRLKKLGNVFMTSRVLSAQEAAMRALGLLPLEIWSRTVQFINTNS